MNPRRFYTYAAVSDLYQEQCGDVGVLEFLRSTFAQSVVANGGYAAVLESAQPLSRRQVKSIGLRRHEKTTWYRLDGTGMHGALVGANN